MRTSAKEEHPKRRFFDWANTVSVKNPGHRKGTKTSAMARRAVLKVIVELCDVKGETFHGQQTIAERASCAEITVRRALAELEELGLITRSYRYDKRGKRTSDLIRLAVALIGSGEQTTDQSVVDYRSDSSSLPVNGTGESIRESSNESFPPSGAAGGGKNKFGFSGTRGCRLPEDFEPDHADATIAGLSPSEHAHEAAKFRDYWIAQPGQKGVKADWRATWRNWCRRAVEDRDNRSSNGRRNFADVARDHLSGRKQTVGQQARDELRRAFGVDALRRAFDDIEDVPPVRARNVGESARLELQRRGEYYAVDDRPSIPAPSVAETVPTNIGTVLKTIEGILQIGSDNRETLTSWLTRLDGLPESEMTEEHRQRAAEIRRRVMSKVGGSDEAAA